MTSEQSILIENYVRSKVRKMLNEASPVDFKSFPKDKQQIVYNIAKHFEANINSKDAFEGIHGLIVGLTKKQIQQGSRMDVDDLKFLAQSGIRWIEPENNGKFTIGL